jgi:hypothetical protein
MMSPSHTWAISQPGYYPSSYIFRSAQDCTLHSSRCRSRACRREIVSKTSGGSIGQAYILTSHSHGGISCYHLRNLALLAAAVLNLAGPLPDHAGIGCQWGAPARCWVEICLNPLLHGVRVLLPKVLRRVSDFANGKTLGHLPSPIIMSRNVAPTTAPGSMSHHFPIIDLSARSHEVMKV